LDVLTKEQRSRCMAAIRDRNTKPEKAIRSLIHNLGYRYRLHVSRLPGKPDLVFKSRKKVIFVHGCFWHRHFCSKGKSMPTTRIKFWKKKLTENKERDKRNRERLKELGWHSLVIWECQVKPENLDKLKTKITDFLEN